MDSFSLQSIKTFTPNLSKDFRIGILKKLNKLKVFGRQTHFIKGRWENQYLEPYHVPEVKDVFLCASGFAKTMIDQSVIVPHQGLGISFDEFWFNIAKPGESTGWHDHKNNATLSGVYYLDVPKNSGDIKFREKNKEAYNECSLSSKTGKMILFDSKLDHSVSINKSQSSRISLSFNLFTLPLEMSIESQHYSSQKFF